LAGTSVAEIEQGGTRGKPVHRNLILVVGANGFIGSEIARSFASTGHEVRRFVRETARGRRVLPEADWAEGDLRHMTAPEDWAEALDGVVTVVNAAGALQDAPATTSTPCITGRSGL
jgi:uncharacterized protein YbjT (DUF2867 family)